MCVLLVCCEAPGPAPPEGVMEEARGNGHSYGTRLGGARANGPLEGESRRQDQLGHQHEGHRHAEDEAHRDEDDEGWLCLVSSRRCEQATRRQGGTTTSGSRHDDVATTDEGEFRLAGVGHRRIDEPRRPGAARVRAHACCDAHVGNAVSRSPLLL